MRGRFGAVAAALCLAALRFVVFRWASENGIAHTATSESRINALRIRCALMVVLIFFFILGLVLCSNSDFLVFQITFLERNNLFSQERQELSRLFLTDFKPRIRLRPRLRRG